MALTPARLLADIDRLPHPERTRTLVETALRLAGTADLDALLDGLFAEGPWAQQLSLRMASVAGHLEHVRRCLDDGPDALQLRAVGHAVRLGLDPAVLVRRLPDLSAAMRSRLVAAVRGSGRTALAEALLEPVRARFGDREAAALLPACSAQRVADELAGLAYAVPSWTALARRHPTVVLDHVEAELASMPRITWAPFLRRVTAALAPVSLDEPDRVLAILERADGEVLLNGSLGKVLAALARHAPARVLELLLSPRRRAAMPEGRKLWRALTALDDPALVRLARALDHRRLVRLLHVIPPHRRAAVYDAVLGGHDLVELGVPMAVLDELPWRPRHEEARRLLALRSVTSDSVVRLEVTARLSWAEAEPVLGPAAARPLAEERAHGYQLLCTAAAGSRDPLVVEGLLTWSVRLRNEQDPVRVVALTSMARIPTRLLTDTAAELLASQAVVAVQARDASVATAGAAQSISVRLLRDGIAAGRPSLREAGLDSLRDASGHLDHLALAGLAGSLPAGADRLVLDALMPRIKADERLGVVDVVLRFAESLDRRAWALPVLQDLLGRACSNVGDATARRAMALWLAPPTTRDQRVAELVAKDTSTLVVPAVAEALAARRTDLLDKVLGKAPRGRFATKGVRIVPAIARHCDRWVPRQVDRYRTLLAGVAADPRANAWERAAALRLLGRVPGSADLVRAHLDDRMPQLADTALAALAWTDDPAAVLPDLLARAEGDRAHVAFAAATRCARFVTPDALAAPLSAVLSAGKVTARKEACRLLAEHRPPGALAALTAELARPDQHRDVRRAVVSALRHLLDFEDAWSALATVPQEGPVATALLETGPDWIATRHRPRYALLVHDVASHPEPDVAVQGMWMLPAWVRWDETGALVSLAADRVTDLDGHVSSAWRAGVATLGKAAELGTDGPLLDAVRALILAHESRDLAEFDAGARDMPARQRLQQIAWVVSGSARMHSDAAATALAVSSMLGDHALVADLAVAPALESVPWAVPAEAAPVLLDVAGLAAQASVLDVVLDAVRSMAHARLISVDPAGTHDLVRRLVADTRPEAARVGLALLEQQGEQHGWDEARREVLRDLRRNADPAVRLAAVQVLTSSE